MQTYESNLRDAAHAVPGTVADTAGTGLASDLGTSTFASGAAAGGIGAGMPWQRLVGANAGATAVGSGAMSGAFTDAALTRAGLLASDEASLEMTNPKDMYPSFAGRWGRGGEGEEHEDRMPHPLQDHFSIEGASVVPGDRRD
jgi:hypothetical protein